MKINLVKSKITCSKSFLNAKNVFLVEEVREIVQLDWPDAETGVLPDDQNRACSVLSNYMDNGEF